jgi:ABC-type glycerol-3-phosphate transport system substrate-binding protein
MESTMMLHRIRIALAATLLALAAVSAVDSASAADFGPYTRPISPGMDSLTLATWRAMGSPSGGEVVADFSLNGWGVFLLPFIEQENLYHLGP